MTPLELSESIEKGLKAEGVVESHADFLQIWEGHWWRACALGLAIIGKTGDARKAYDLCREAEEREAYKCYLKTAAAVLGIPHEAARAINTAHCSEISAQDIADRLRTADEHIVAYADYRGYVDEKECYDDATSV